MPEKEPPGYSKTRCPWPDSPSINNGEQIMTRSILLAALAIAGFNVANTKEASAVVYCTYVGYPANCVVRPGVVLRPRPVARAAVRHNAGGNLNGGVNRVGAGREITCFADREGENRQLFSGGAFYRLGAEDKRQRPPPASCHEAQIVCHF